jgi:hypothetical protein
MLEMFSAIRPQHWDALGLTLAQNRAMPLSVAPSHAGLQAAIQWIKAAQDASGNGGVSWGFRARCPIRSGISIGWMPAYPETTGYIIETMLKFARLENDPNSRERAKRMADWEVSIQLPDGGTQGGILGAQPVASSTFVTGQVMFGFLSMYEDSGDIRYLEAARRSGDFLLSCLDENGRFVKGYSHFCKSGPKAYEARTGWAIAWLGKITGDSRYSDAARRMAQYAVSCQMGNGWFCENDLDFNEKPLTHTIGYVLEGLWEIGMILDAEPLLQVVLRSLNRIQPLIGETGFLAGRWTSDWKPAASWSCLTGSSQIALVYLRANSRFPSEQFVANAEKLLSFVAGTQAQTEVTRALVGGIQGSYPFDGEYGQYCFLNWAAKFYCDAVMEFLSLKGASDH